jgi:hypothetical protein
MWHRRVLVTFVDMSQFWLNVNEFRSKWGLGAEKHIAMFSIKVPSILFYFSQNSNILGNFIGTAPSPGTNKFHENPFSGSRAVSCVRETGVVDITRSKGISKTTVHLVGPLPDPPESKICSWIPRDWESKLTVLARTRSNLPVCLTS